MQVLPFKTTFNQQQWFKNATIEERSAFISKGEPGAIECINNVDKDWQGGNIVYRPLVRGMIVTKDTHPTHSEAVAAAAQVIQDLQKQDLPILDEEALGITSKNLDLVAEIEGGHEWAIENTIHIASQALHLSETFLEFFSDFDADFIHKAFAGEISEKATRWLDDMLDADDVTRDDVSEFIHEFKLYGWFLQAAKPVVTPCGDGESCHYSWGYYSTQWIYAETYELALDKARAWVAERHAKEMAKSAH